jgi:antitoxin component YwqK of YwqJK toxin-antitoxin module
MKNFVLILFLILALKANAQDKQIITMNGKGAIEEVGYLTTEGKKDSTWTRYNDMGIVIATAQFSKGLKHGVWETFNDKGIKIYEIVYAEGCKKFGKHWDENGILIEIKVY